MKPLHKPPKNGWFEAIAKTYVQNRPMYPESFFEWINQKSHRNNRCWDVACGSGQASVGLAKYFEEVQATDLSPAQIASARSHPKVHYSVSSAEDSGLPSKSIDVIVVAAAIHWLNVSKFNTEALRVIQPQGLIVWVGYEPLQGAPNEIQNWLNEIYTNGLRTLWPPQRQHVDNQYKDLPFPGLSQKIPSEFSIPLKWTKEELMGFIRTWSAFRQSKENGSKLLKTLDTELKAIWPKEQLKIDLYLPLMGIWGYIEK